MRVKLDEELKKGKEDLAKQADMNLSETKQLLIASGQEDMHILRHLGANSTLVQLENLSGKTIELENLEKEYGQVFTIGQIEDLAVDYRLRFLASRLFIGKMDVEVTAKVKEFFKKTNMASDEHTLQTKFFVLATPDSFSLEKHRVEHFKGIKQALMDNDPVLFYKIDDIHYRMIHKWGKDFTIFRRLLGYKWKSPNKVRTFNFFAYMPIFALILGLLFPAMVATTPFLSVGLVILATAIFAWVRNLQYVDEGGTFSSQETEYYDKYFTPHNWNTTAKLVN